METEVKCRYSRQIAVKEVGIVGQESLLRSKVAIVGCGALGSMVAMQLAGAGVGRLCIADFDTVDVSNLQRQFFFKESEAGESKSLLVAKRISELNKGVSVDCMECIVTSGMAENMLRDCDFVVDATDNPSSKLMIERVCRKLGKPYCIGGVSGFRGQVMTVVGGYGFEDVFAGIPESESTQSPANRGVTGPAAAFCASYQSSEVIKYLVSQRKDCERSSLFVFDLYCNSFQHFMV